MTLAPPRTPAPIKKIRKIRRPAAAPLGGTRIHYVAPAIEDLKARRPELAHMLTPTIHTLLTESA